MNAIARKLALLRAPKARETVEQFLARGGVVQTFPRGQGGDCRKCGRTTHSGLQMVAYTGQCQECYGGYMQRVHGGEA